MKDRFPVHDITHKPRRTQAGNIQAANEISGKSVGGYEVDDVSLDTSTDPVLKFPTIESAVGWYTRNSKGDCTKLFKSTAAWLTELSSLRAMKSKYEALLEKNAQTMQSKLDSIIQRGKE